jgi:ferredoxin
VTVHVRVDPIACEAHGMCAELLPEAVVLDEWGYPIVDGRPLPEALVEHAERAVRACPTFALLLQRRLSREHPRDRVAPDMGRGSAPRSSSRGSTPASR